SKAVGRTTTTSIESAHRVAAKPERRERKRLYYAFPGNGDRNAAAVGGHTGDECGQLCPVVERLAAGRHKNCRVAGTDPAAGDQLAQIGARTFGSAAKGIFLIASSNNW